MSMNVFIMLQRTSKKSTRGKGFVLGFFFGCNLFVIRNSTAKIVISVTHSLIYGNVLEIEAKLIVIELAYNGGRE